VHVKTVHDDGTVVTANALGPLRVRFFGLPGGAPGAIALINEQLQALLVGHGHPTGTDKAQANRVRTKSWTAKQHGPHSSTRRLLQALF
jgi:ribulose bisphosphate carboxylase small subunit